MLLGHGSLAMTCRTLTIAEGLGQEVKEYRKGSERYGSW